MTEEKKTEYKVDPDPKEAVRAMLTVRQWAERGDESTASATMTYLCGIYGFECRAMLDAFDGTGEEILNVLRRVVDDVVKQYEEDEEGTSISGGEALERIQQFVHGVAP